MALTTDQTDRLYRILGHPGTDTLVRVYSYGNRYDAPINDQCTFASISAALAARIAALGAEQIVQIQTLLTRHALIEVSVTKTRDTSGSILADHEKERANIKAACENILSFRIMPESQMAIVR